MSLTETLQAGFEVGRFYRVPCVLTEKHSWLGSGWQPVIGPMHSDAGVVNFPYNHWHIDLRFVPKKVRYLPEFLIGTPIMKDDLYGSPVVTAGPEPRLKKCQRPMPVYPIHRARWIPALEAEYTQVRMKNMVCPHRGLPLHGCPQDGDIVTCPGHGLRWNVKTGELVKGN